MRRQYCPWLQDIPAKHTKFQVTSTRHLFGWDNQGRWISADADTQIHWRRDRVEQCRPGSPDANHFLTVLSIYPFFSFSASRHVTQPPNFFISPDYSQGIY